MWILLCACVHVLLSTINLGEVFRFCISSLCVSSIATVGGKLTDTMKVFKPPSQLAGVAMTASIYFTTPLGASIELVTFCAASYYDLLCDLCYINIKPLNTPKHFVLTVFFKIFK